MIPKNKIEEAALENSIGTDYPETEQDAFYVGVKWAEKELENLAIEFAEWVGKKEYTYYNIGHCIPSWFDKNNHSLDCDTKELFEIFKKEKYEYEH